MKYPLIILLFSSFFINIFADGIIVPYQEDYPSDYLKNRITDIYVEINGLIAETFVYQEFENEWNDTIDGVYSFPLPPNARVTRLQYTLGDTLIDAVLKVQKQTTTPGTGEGGVISEINKYMGNNVLRLALSNIHPQGIKGVRLSYITALKQYNGTYEYNYPLNTGDFIKHPLDFLRIRIKVTSTKSISGFDLISHPGYRINSVNTDSLDIEYLKPKSYTATDIKFNYWVENSPFSIDLYSWKPDAEDGYFTMVGKPQIESADSSLSQNLIFLLGNSTTMIGNKLNQSKTAISLAIGELTEKDSFNILIFNNSVTSWQTKIVPATGANISSAQDFIENIGAQSGNRLDIGINAALNMLTNPATISSMLVFCDGKSPVDPKVISNLNRMKTGICFVAIGNDIDRLRLEAVAGYNYGFVSYIGENNVLSSEMLGVFQKIKSPLLKEVILDFDNPMVHSLFPVKYPAVFAGSDLMLSGRYQIPGLATIKVEGNNSTGENAIQFVKDFSGNDEIGRKLWAKSAIDDIEAQILIYGENDSLKNELIDLSLTHNIRCRYTAFTEGDTLTQEGEEDPDIIHDWELSSVAESIMQNNESLLSGYPNPFNQKTILRIVIPEQDYSKSRFIQIFDSSGRLIKIINLSHLNMGFNEIVLNEEDFGNNGRGVYFVHLIIENTLRSSIKMIKIE